MCLSIAHELLLLCRTRLKRVKEYCLSLLYIKIRDFKSFYPGINK